MSQTSYVDTIRLRLTRESGTLQGHGRRNIAMVYPSPYNVGMSSLGFQTVYRLLNHMEDTAAERAFLPDDGDEVHTLLTYETQRPVSDFPVLAFSVSYELEIAGALTCLQKSGVPLVANERTDRHPLVVMGGPLTFSNPVPLAPFADVIIMGEAEDLLKPLCDAVFEMSREAALKHLASLPGFYVPCFHGEVLMPVAQAGNSNLPACSAIITPDTALSNMFLIETERGCSRGCTFCVMRRSTNGGMRVVPLERIISEIPDHAKKVGFVGAAVSDHPRVVQLLRHMVDSGRQVSLSSLRADRLTFEFVELLAKGGYRTLTIASDGASERLRSTMEKRIYEKHLLRAAEFAGATGIAQLKNYMMIGVPDETDADLDELIAFTKRQGEAAGPRVKVSLGIAPFVAKRNTPMDRFPFVGIAEAERRLERLRRGLHPRIEVRPTSARWAWVEYQLAQGGAAEGLKVMQAWRDGANFAAYKRAFAAPKEKKRRERPLAAVGT